MAKRAGGGRPSRMDMRREAEAVEAREAEAEKEKEDEEEETDDAEPEPEAESDADEGDGDEDAKRRGHHREREIADPTNPHADLPTAADGIGVPRRRALRRTRALRAPSDSRR